MTRRKFRQLKRIRMDSKTNPDPGLEKPVDQEPDLVEKLEKDWKLSFLSQFSWFKTKIS